MNASWVLVGEDVKDACSLSEADRRPPRKPAVHPQRLSILCPSGDHRCPLTSDTRESQAGKRSVVSTGYPSSARLCPGLEEPWGIQ